MRFKNAFLVVLAALAAAAILGSPMPRVAADTSIVPTYRVAESVAVTVTASTGDIAELRGAAGKTCRLKRITIAKPSVAFTLTVVKRSSRSTRRTGPRRRPQWATRRSRLRDRPSGRSTRQ